MAKSAKITATVIVFAVFIALIGLIFSTRFATAPNQMGLHYNAGPFTATKFNDCVDPSQRVWNAPANKHYAYPIDKRTFTFTDEAIIDGTRVDSLPIVALSQDSIELKVRGFVDFRLTTDCELLQKFHEDLGLKYEAWMDGTETSEGWHELLFIYVNQPLQRAIDEATQKYNWQDLYSDPATKTAWENDVKTLLPNYIRQTMGDDYFAITSVTIQKPELPQPILDALRATQVAIEENNAQVERNKQITTELESIRALVELLGPDGYNTYEAIKSGKIQVVPVPQGSSIIVNPTVPAPDDGS